VTTRSYDALNRLHRITYADNSTITYTYDAGNRVTTIADSVSGTITRNYDDLDRVISETTPEGIVSYTYDKADRRATMTVAGQPTVTYRYDDANRLTSVTQGASIVLLTHDDADRRSTLTLPNGIVTTYSYDEADQLTGLTYTIGQSSLGSLTYMYDLSGRRAEVGGTLARTNLPQGVAVTSYDAVNRPMEWGNLLVSSDANGSLASDGVMSFTFDTREQLATVTGSAAAAFAYDGLGRRVGVTVSGSSSTVLHDGVNPITWQTGPTVATRLTGLEVDEWFAWSDSTGTVYPLRDGLGSTVALVGEDGSIQRTFSYEPYGKSVVTGLATTSSPQRFTGREDDGFGPLYYRARYYDPALGRFISEDPAEFDADLNLFAYVGNGPTNNTDPFGLQSWPTNSTHVADDFGSPRKPKPHDGADIRNRLNWPVYSTDCGKVIEVSTTKAGINQLRVLNCDGSVSGYAHTKATVKVGDCVKECQVIGHSDGSGTTSPHLHLTFRATVTSPKSDPLPRLRPPKMCRTSPQ
jgi:RHS repeat-associated protein